MCVCLIDGQWQTRYDSGGSGAAAAEDGGGADDALDGLNDVKDEGKCLAVDLVWRRFGRFGVRGGCSEGRAGCCCGYYDEDKYRCSQCEACRRGGRPDRWKHTLREAVKEGEESCHSVGSMYEVPGMYTMRGLATLPPREMSKATTRNRLQTWADLDRPGGSYTSVGDGTEGCFGVDEREKDARLKGQQCAARLEQRGRVGFARCGPI